MLVTTPPGTTKSIIFAVMFPAWVWLADPSTRLLTASNESDIVIRDAVASRRLIESEWYTSRWGGKVSLTSDQNVKGWFENNHRGYRTATTVGSSVTGKKGDVLLLDDPHDAKKVYSERSRNDVKLWWKQAFFNRVNDAKTSKRIVVGQRTHLHDLQGDLAKDPQFVHLNLTEEFEPSRKCVTSIGWSDWRTEPGELLRPDRFGPKEVEQAKLTLGVNGYNAQHQQNPIAVEGAEFPLEWFGDSIWFDEWPREYACRVSALDPSKGKNSKSGDYSAFVNMLVDVEGICWIEADLGRYNLKLLAEMSVENYRKFQANVFAVEAVQYQELLEDQIVQLARKMNLMIPAVPTHFTAETGMGNKEIRIRSLAAYLGRGDFRFKANSPGTALLVEQLRQFPHGDHDDGPDALQIAVFWACQLINGNREDQLSEPIFDNVFA